MVPEGWSNLKALTNYVALNSRRPLNRDHVVPFVEMAALKPWTSKIQYFGQRRAGSGSRFINGDTLFARITPCAENGKIAFVDILPRGVTGQGSTEFIVVTPKEGVDSKYIYYLCCSQLVHNYAIARMEGTSGRQRIPNLVFEEIFLSFPPLEEQRRIAAILSSVDAAIEATEAVIAQTRKVKQGLLQELLTRGIGHTRFKHTEIGEIPESWDVVRLEEIASLDRGRFSARPRNDPQYYGGNWPFIQTGDVTNTGDYVHSYSQSLNDKGLRVSKLFQRGTLFITIAANIGDVAICDFDTACPDSLVGIVPNSDINNYWLLMFLRKQKKELNSKATQNAQKNINLQTLRPLLVPLPPLKEQEQIATLLEGIEDAMTSSNKQLTRLKTLKRGLMQDLLTGKVRV